MVPRADDPAFEPAWPAATNPVLRRPPLGHVLASVGVLGDDDVAVGAGLDGDDVPLEAIVRVRATVDGLAGMGVPVLVVDGGGAAAADRERPVTVVGESSPRAHLFAAFFVATYGSDTMIVTGSLKLSNCEASTM